MMRILVATDGSEGADHALDFAARLAKETHGTILVVNVSGDLSAEDLRALAQVEGGLVEELSRLSNQVLDQARQRLEANGISDVRTQLAWGQPAAGILEAAGTFPADIIVIGRRGRGRLAGLLLGSICQKLASLSPCPVIIVP